MKLLSAVLAILLAGCTSLANVASPTVDPTVANIVLAVVQASADYKAHGCITQATVSSIMGTACGVTTATNATQQNAISYQCLIATTAFDLVSNKICPVPTVAAIAASVTAVKP